MTEVVLVTGSTLSGTTLLLDMLRAHPRVFGPFELGLLLAEGMDRHSLAQWYARHRVHATFLSRYINAARLVDMAESCDDWRGLYERLFAHMVQVDHADGRDVMIDKMPGYANRLFTHVYPKLPDVRTIVLVRDPRGVYCSWRKLGKRQEPGTRWFTDRYVAIMHSAVTALEAGQRVLLVRFEQLVISPSETMQEVARFVGIDYDPAMADPKNSYAQHSRTRFVYPYSTRKRRSASLDHTTISEWSDMLAPGVADGIVAALPEDMIWVLHDSGKDLPCRSTQST